MIDSLQSLRGIFAIFIFLHHFTIEGKGLFEAGGACGVTFFFILSGFVMCAGYERKEIRSELKFRKYYLRRIVRVYPLHILCLVSFLLINIFGLTRNQIFILLPNLLLLQSWVPINLIYFSGNAVSWCLCDLMYFYALFPLLINWIRNSPKFFYTTFLTILILYIFLIPLIPQRFQHALIYINPLFRLIDFILGIILWQIWVYMRDKHYFIQLQSISTRYKSLIEAASILGLCVPILYYTKVISCYSLASLWWFSLLFLILTFALFNRGGAFSTLFNYKPLVVFGNVSFSFYMIHLIGLGVIRRLLKIFWPTANIATIFMLTLSILIFLSFMVYKYIEIPINRYLSRKYNLLG